MSWSKRSQASGERQDSEAIEVIIDFKRPRKTDADADKAIQLWLEPKTSKEIAKHLACGESYVSRLLRIGRKTEGHDARRIEKEQEKNPRLIRVERRDMRKLLRSHALVVGRTLPDRRSCQTPALQFDYDQRGRPTLARKSGSSNPQIWGFVARLEQRVVELFDANSLEIQAIADKVHLGHTKVMEIVRNAYRRLGREVPDGRTRRTQLTGHQSSSAPS